MTNKRRVLLTLIFVVIIVAMLGSVLAKQDESQHEVVNAGTRPFSAGKPTELVLRRGGSTNIDLRRLKQTHPKKREQPEHEEPEIERTEIPGGNKELAESVTSSVSPQSAPAPAPSSSFDGLDFANWGAGHPPDPNGDVGPTYYIQTINTSIGVFQKSNGSRIAAFTFDTLMAEGFGDVRASGNFGDPVVLYDTFEDRWIITDFAFTLDTNGNVVNPPGEYQVFAVSKTNDPVAGGWNFYSTNVVGGFGDYPKLGIWPDGLYMSVNLFGYASGAPFQNPRVFAFNKAQMYAGAPTAQVVSFNAPASDFAVMPSNARLQAGTPPPGTPNYFVSTWEFLNALTVYKFHVDWNHLSLSTFTGPDAPLAATSWPNASVPNAPSQGGNALDVLQIRAMVQNQYSNLGGVESLWTCHTVRRQNTTGFAAPRWYQVNVTGGTVAANLPQAATWDPDGANVIYRFMPSLAVDRAGDMAMGYSTSSSTTKPAIKYAGRLAGDPVNTFSQTEQLLTQGTGTQTGNCGGSTCIRWGDYSAMTLDPDGCTFWYTNQYYSADGLSFLTRIGSFSFGSCTPVGNGGTVSGTVTATVGGAPITGATVALGARTVTTDVNGSYSFANIPAGVYPVISASNPGFTSSSVNSIVVSDSTTTTQNFSLANAASSACLTDTTQTDFQAGTPTAVDLVTSPGDVILLGGPMVDQQNTTLGTSGVGVTTTTWGGQTFTPSVTGKLDKVDLNMFCSGCTGTTPNLTLSLRATSGGLPTGADLASGTITGFSSGAAVFYTATFGTPPTVTAGTQYALAVRPTANPSPGTYALTRSGTATAGSDVYAGGTRVSGATSGTVWSIPLTGGVSTDAGFRVYIDAGFELSGNFVSSTKDSNPPAGQVPTWSTLSWDASTPANTNINFQLAASNSVNGPFNFVGPDGTAGTFFTTSGASISQFDGNRYLEYKAYLTTTDPTMTPTLNDVTVCYSDVDCTGTDATITPTPAQVCPNSTGNTASAPAGATSYSWSITNGTITGGATSQTVTYTAGASGNVSLMLMLTAANTCPASNSISVPIVSPPATPTVGGTTNGTGTQNEACAAEPLTLTATSAGATSYQWYVGGNMISGQTSSTTTVTSAGTYTVTATNSCTTTSPSAGYVVTDPTPAKPTTMPQGPTTFCQGGSVTLQASSGTGIQWYNSAVAISGANSITYVATASGSYTCTLSGSGCPSAASDPIVVTVNSTVATPTVMVGGPTALCPGGSVNLTSSSATGNQWYAGGNLINGATNQVYTATAAGNYTVIVSASGCSSLPSSAVTVTMNSPPAVMVSPASQTVSSSVTFTAAASGTPAPSVQWQVSTDGGTTFTNIPGATSTTLTVTLTPTQSGYKYRAVFTNTCGTATTAAATATILNMCLRDDSSGNYFRFNSMTGQYLLTMCSTGFTLSGTATVTNKSGILTLTDSKSDRKVSAGYNTGQKTGTATITLILGSGLSQTIRITQTNPNAVCNCSG